MPLRYESDRAWANRQIARYADLNRQRRAEYSQRSAVHPCAPALPAAPARPAAPALRGAPVATEHAAVLRLQAMQRGRLARTRYRISSVNPAVTKIQAVARARAVRSAAAEGHRMDLPAPTSASFNEAASIVVVVGVPVMPDDETPKTHEESVELESMPTRQLSFFSGPVEEMSTRGRKPLLQIMRDVNHAKRAKSTSARSRFSLAGLFGCSRRAADDVL
mmetsp:Transcript_10798/g.26840  ORF Transcript_10798/g.26840 Transcript_10798/m.26840 type:complete len:220 (-) Transcript_10798:417-1076(-)